MKRILLSCALFLGLTLSAFAQTSPNLIKGQVLTAAQWNALFVAKQDTLGFVPLSTAGGVMIGPMVTAPSSSVQAGFNIPPGTAPGTPSNGDIWTSASGMFIRINGVTLNLSSTSLAVGSSIVNGGPGVLYNTTSGGTLTALAPVNNTVLSFNGSGTFQASTTLPSGLSAANMNLSGPTTITSNSASALAVGPNGATNPTFLVAASIASAANGIKITSTAAGSNAFIDAISSGTNDGIVMNGKGSGVVTIGNTSSGGITLGGGGGNVSIGGSALLTVNTVPASSAANQATITVGSGTIALGTSAISAGACGTASTATVTGAITSDIVDLSFAADPTATTGYIPPSFLSIVAWPTAGGISVKQCNNTGLSITPSALSLNYKVRR